MVVTFCDVLSCGALLHADKEKRLARPKVKIPICVKRNCRKYCMRVISKMSELPHKLVGFCVLKK